MEEDPAPRSMRHQQDFERNVAAEMKTGSLLREHRVRRLAGIRSGNPPVAHSAGYPALPLSRARFYGRAYQHREWIARTLDLDPATGTDAMFICTLAAQERVTTLYLLSGR